jgi:hypothetical protein
LTGGVVLDVTSLISAEDYLVSQNRRARPADPFARQCFVEMIQTLLFVEEVFVAHPTRLDAEPDDFGQRPYLLQELVRAGLLQPLQLNASQAAAAQAAQASALSDLKSPLGTRSMVQFVDQMLICDGSRPSEGFSMSARLRGWADFQRENVRVAGHHRARIDTSDGVEEDGFGSWARAAAVVMEGSLEAVVPRGEGLYLMATLARGIKYGVRAEAAALCYQPHPMRRDFSLTFDLNRGGAESHFVLDVIKAVRGIHDSLAEAMGHQEPYRLRVLELELPLIGGRLWKSSEAGRLSDERWISLVVTRIIEYRERAADLRSAIGACATDEDYLLLARDIEEVRNRLLESLRVRTVEPNRVEQELVDSVASVTQAATGVSVVRGVYFGTKGLGQHLSRRLRGQPFQQFLYREFLRAWKIAGR